MPRCGSQITLCDLPIRFDNYAGCSHGCAYCFANYGLAVTKRDANKIKLEEGITALNSFIKGGRTSETEWCDWDIPLHWGGMSDPFQEVELNYGSSYACLKLFADAQYPFVVSTKGRVIGERKYIDVLKCCNCVVQISLVSPQFDRLEQGAPSFLERVNIVEKLAGSVKRVVIRVQPFVLEVLGDVLKQLALYKQIGAHGITIEGIKYKRARRGLVKVGGDFCYPVSVLESAYMQIKSKCHELGLQFYCAENRLRNFGDSLCCCGVTGLAGFETNKYNLIHYLYDNENFVPTNKMQARGSARVFGAIKQETVGHRVFTNSSFADIMQVCTRDKNMILNLINSK